MQNIYCQNCGTKIPEDGSFCEKCGTKISSASSSTNLNSNDFIFYSEDWQRQRVLAIASLPYFDIAFDKEYFYIIKLPNYNSGTLGLIIGLIILNVIGAVIGNVIGNSSDKKARKKYRLSWIDSNSHLISRNYEKDLFLKIPLTRLKDSLILKRNKIIVNYNNKKIVLRKYKGEYNRFLEYFKKLT